MAPLDELLHLLSCRQLQGEPLTACVDDVQRADENEDYDWMEEASERRQFAVSSVLSDWVAIGDKVDELHEIIIDGFSEELPAYPYRDDKNDFTPPMYFRWLDDVLAAHGRGYELLLWDNAYDDNLYAFAVERADTQRILDLSGALGFSAYRATDAYAA